MENRSITTAVNLNNEIFKRFAWFDAFFRQGRFKLLLGFAVIMSAFGVIALLFAPGDTDSSALVFILFGVGLLLPTAHVLQFSSSLNKQCKLYGLKNGKYVYTITLADDEISISDGKGENAKHKLEMLHKIYVDEDASYIYVIKQKAFLLPYKDINGGKDVFLKYIENNIKDKQIIKYIGRKP